MDTAYVYDPVFLEHNLPSHPENAHRLTHTLDVLEKEGVLSRSTLLSPRPATLDEIRLIHTDALIEQVRRVCQSGGGYLDADTYVNARSYDVALIAAGGLIHAVEALLNGEIANAFALVRPPGHHATADRAMGFCLFNNIAIAARAAQRHPDIQRVFIADFDVHHGNGTQDAFAADPSVFYFSTHQYPHYPGSGYWKEIGVGAGAGTLLYVPLQSRVGDDGYRRIFSELVWPLAERFQPNLILVSAGYDAHWSDPLAEMNLSLTGYAQIARELVGMANQLCKGRIAFTLEGGYRLEVLAYGILNTFYALFGEETILDPVGPSPYADRPVDAIIAHLKDVHYLS